MSATDIRAPLLNNEISTFLPPDRLNPFSSDIAVNRERMKRQGCFWAEPELPQTLQKPLFFLASGNTEVASHTV